MATRQPTKQAPLAAANAWRWMSVLHTRLMEQFNTDAAAAGTVPFNWFEVLSALDAAPRNRVRLKDLVDTALLTKAGVSRLLDRVEKAGYIRREPSPCDGRGLEAVLTPAGSTALFRARTVYLKSINEKFGRHVTAAQTDGLIELFRKVLEANDMLPDVKPVTVTVARQNVAQD